MYNIGQFKLSFTVTGIHLILGVSVNFTIFDLYSFQEIEISYWSKFSIELTWYDSRLKFRNLQSEWDLRNRDNLLTTILKLFFLNNIFFIKKENKIFKALLKFDNHKHVKIG